MRNVGGLDMSKAATVGEYDLDRDNLFEFLYPSQDRGIEWLYVAATIREHIDSLPKTTNRLRLRDLPFSSGIRSGLNEELMWFCGSWVMPDAYRSHDDRRVYINPNYAHVKQFASVYAQCPCGNKLTSPARTNGGEGKLTEHTDKCRMQWQSETDAEIYRQRYRIIKHGLLLGLDMSDIAPRVGMHQQQATKSAWRLGIDIEAVKKQASDNMNRAMYELRQWYTTAEIGAAFGIHFSAVSRRSTEYGRSVNDPLDLLRAV